jgi:hypothetical protein
MVCTFELIFNCRIYFFLITKAKQLIQIAILGAQVIGRAFTRALRQEFQCKKNHILK